MKVYIMENSGLVKVTDSNGKPLSKVYVKCFTKDTSNSTKFFKDGYTDLRGTFDYATLNVDSGSNISKFALFISGTENGMGSIIKEARRPNKVVVDEGVKKSLVSKAWMKKGAGVPGKAVYSKSYGKYAMESED